jgi:hypothetical protein
MPSPELGRALESAIDSGLPAKSVPVEHEVAAPLLAPASPEEDPPSAGVPDEEPLDELDDGAPDDDPVPAPDDEPELEDDEKLVLPPASPLSELLELEQPPNTMAAHGASKVRHGQIAIRFMKTPVLKGA